MPKVNKENVLVILIGNARRKYLKCVMKYRWWGKRRFTVVYMENHKIINK